MSPSRRAGTLLALVTAGVSGCSVFVNSYGVRAFGDPTAYTTGKNVVAAVLLLVAVTVGARAGAGARLTRPTSRGQWWALAAIGVVGGSVPFVLFFEGLARADAPQAAFLHKTLLLWVALMAVPLLGERLEWGHWVAVGLLVVAQVGLVGGVTETFGTPEAMILAATLLWAVEVVVAKRVLAGVSSWTVGVARMGVGSVVLLGWVAVRGDLGVLTSMTGEQAGWLLLTGAFLAAYVATWLAALARAWAVDVTAVLVLALPVTVLLDAVVDGAPLPEPGWLAVLLLGGAVAVRTGLRRPAAEVRP